MAGAGEGEGEGNILKLENQIAVIKYVMLFTNIIEWMIGASVFGLCLWLRFEPNMGDWFEKLEISQFYTGIYVLIISGVIIMVVSFAGCISALQENAKTLLIYIGTQVVAFIFGLAGSAVLLDNSARDSHFQPLIRESMHRLIMNTHHEPSKQALALIQESIACCGADGPGDYDKLKQSIPTECRDSVTGNSYFHGCVDEMTWFVEGKCAWIAALVMTVCFFHVVNVVLATVLIGALKKEEEQSETYRR